MEQFGLLHYSIFLVTGICAGFVDSIAGGGGIISIPVLMWAGIPPHLVLGTNKLQSSFGSFTASVNYSRKGLVDISSIWKPVLYTAVGAACGTATIQLISAEFLQKIIPFCLLVIFIYTLFTPNLGHGDQKARMGKKLFYAIFGLLLGFYDGFFGPGTGSFWTMAAVLLLGLNLKKSTALTKVVNFTSNIVALVVFIFGGNVLFTVGILMGFGQIIGASWGSKMVLVRDVSFIRTFFLSVVGLTLVRLIWSSVISG